MSQSFADLGASRQVVKALAKRGITKPFAVQEMVIGDVLAGHDVLVQSPTGSGKTLAFGIPMVARIESGDRRPSALVLAPTRELAGQIVDELADLVVARGLQASAVYGGVGIQPQIKRAKRSNILVATPGRLEDLLARGAVSLANVEMLVLDEADRMLDMGFKPAVDRIVAKTPKGRQTLFFSATLEGATGKVAAAYTNEARKHVQEAKPERRADVDHRFVHLRSQSEKLPVLVKELRSAERGRTLVFVRTKRGADRLVKRLGASKVRAVAMHGNKSQSQRQRALASFDRGDVDTLVATDVAARGIDVAEVTHVINFDAPEDRDAYVHRVGRTGRAGATGAGISFVLADQATEMRQIAAELDLTAQFDRHSGGNGRRNGSTSRQHSHSGNGHGRGGAGGGSRSRNRARR
jgi:ATP-dependent RNA helicase RhlE